MEWYILYCRGDLTAEQIESLVAQKQTQFEGLLNENVALELVASELNVPIKLEIREVKLKLANLIEKISNVNLVATVEKVWPKKTFTHQDGREGKVVNIIVSDETGERNLVVWTEHADMASQLQPGQKIEINGAYTREDNYGKFEVVIGRNGYIKTIKEEKT